MIGRRSLLAGVSAGVCVPAMAAQPRRMTLITGGPADSAVDIAARSFAPFLERHLPRYRVEVENRPGASGVVAYRAVAGASTDGTVLGWVSTPALPTRCVERDDRGLLRRLVLLGTVAKEPIAIVAPASERLRTMADLMRVAASEPVAVTAAGSPAHLAALRLQLVTGVPLDLLTFPTGAAVRQATAAGNVAAGVMPLSEAASGLREEHLVPLGVASLKAEAFPVWPPLVDQGCRLCGWIYRGLAAPAGLPAARVARLGVALQSVVADPEFRAQSDGAGILPHYISGTEWTERVAAEEAEITRLWNTQTWRPGSATG
jgi:tripartite-type tricarboxylate transporter receptor subunit TctC